MEEMSVRESIICLTQWNMLESIRDAESSENRERRRGKSFSAFSPSNLELESRTVVLLFTQPVWVPFTGLNSHC